MIYHIIPVIVVSVLVLAGHFIKRKRIANFNKRFEFTVDFNNKFFDMANSLFTTYRLDSKKYNAVIKDVDEIQRELGQDGVLNEFVDPLRGMKGKNYQLFMNIMPEIRSIMSDMDNLIMKERINQMMGLCEDALKRHLGKLERIIDYERKGLYNPFNCLGEGIRWIVGLPVDILYWAGILSENRSTKIKTGIIFKFIGNVIVFVGLISSIFTIVLGWDEFFEILNYLIVKK